MQVDKKQFDMASLFMSKIYHRLFVVLIYYSFSFTVTFINYVDKCHAMQPLSIEPMMESRVTEDPLAALLPHYIKKSNVDPYLTRNMTTQVGQTVYLHCIVNLVGDRTVSWIRLRDFHLLTVGKDTYTSDTRFQSMYMQISNDWVLQIKYPQLSDEGLYECQVSSFPSKSIYFRLFVVALQTNAIEPDTVAKSECKDEEGSSEVTEPEKPQSLDELCENFKDAFLDVEESDVIFKVGDKEYPAHKIIIKVRSPVFRAMLKHNMKEKEEGIINIPDCDPLIFRDFLSYIYTGKLDSISGKNVCELYQLSDKYDVKGLKKECLYFMHNSLSVDIICDVISIAATHCERNLLSRATQFFIDHAQDILESVQWQNFVQEHPTEANELFLKTFKKISRK